MEKVAAKKIAEAENKVALEQEKAAEEIEEANKLVEKAQEEEADAKAIINIQNKKKAG
jgi:hypothetical protein